MYYHPYRGETKNGWADGRGTAFLPDGRTTTGLYRTNIPEQSKDSFQWPNSTLFVGPYQADGSTEQYRYSGETQNGWAHGQGTTFYPDGISSSGTYVHGRRVGLGFDRFPCGSYFVGNFDNVRSGAGEEHYPDGSKKQGWFKAGEKQGWWRENWISQESKRRYFENGKLVENPPISARL